MIVLDIVISLFVVVLLQFAGMYVFSLMTPTAIWKKLTTAM
jgi:putative membrane protein